MGREPDPIQSTGQQRRRSAFFGSVRGFLGSATARDAAAARHDGGGRMCYTARP